jgi:hypothetical protein
LKKDRQSTRFFQHNPQLELFYLKAYTYYSYLPSNIQTTFGRVDPIEIDIGSKKNRIIHKTKNSYRPLIRNEPTGVFLLERPISH